MLQELAMLTTPCINQTPTALFSRICARFSIFGDKTGQNFSTQPFLQMTGSAQTHDEVRLLKRYCCHSLGHSSGPTFIWMPS